MDSASEGKDPKVDLIPVIDAATVGNQLLSPSLTISQNMLPTPCRALAGFEPLRQIVRLYGKGPLSPNQVRLPMVAYRDRLYR
jgi:hypothetical protein